MTEEKLRDRIRGSLIGGAIGDALGYPVEFMDSFAGIQKVYGEKGITCLETTQLWMEEVATGNGKAVVSDDTQMTLYTACGILNTKNIGTAPKYAICEAYVEWLYTQKGQKRKGYGFCWINSVPELNKRRAPGHTCISALEAISRGGEPVNNSKGCGGVMRVAPVPLYAVVGNRMNIGDADRLAGDSAEITHQHPMGYIPAALASHIIYRLAEDEQPTRIRLVEYIQEAMDMLRTMYPNFLRTDDRFDFQKRIESAIELSRMDMDDVEAVGELGYGWTGDEAIAIAIYCALKYFDNFEQALIAAVNHGGDSDSTGAITGNILGAAVGYNAIPDHFKLNVELHDVILHVADDLWRGETTRYMVIV